MRHPATLLQFDHFSAELFDDIADSITYCNHYMAPIKCSPRDIAACMAAFAKFNHERADLFMSLSKYGGGGGSSSSSKGVQE